MLILLKGQLYSLVSSFCCSFSWHDNRCCCTLLYQPTLSFHFVFVCTLSLHHAVYHGSMTGVAAPNFHSNSWKQNFLLNIIIHSFLKQSSSLAAYSCNILSAG